MYLCVPMLPTAPEVRTAEPAVLVHTLRADGDRQSAVRQVRAGAVAPDPVHPGTAASQHLLAGTTQAAQMGLVHSAR